MKIFNKRIALLVSDQHFIIHGGIGQFIKGFAEMSDRLNWKVDVVLDKPPRDDFLSHFLPNANICFPEKSLSYAQHNGIFQFGDSVNFEKVINFRNSFKEALEKNLYDCVVCNTPEAMTAVYTLSVNNYMPVVFYTHSEYTVFRDGKNIASTFLSEYHKFFDAHLKFDNVYVGTQTERNQAELIENGINAKALYMPMPERELLTRSTQEKSGVLFIGRWEDRKNPKAYIKAMAENGLPCKVMTNENGKKKFEKAFDDAGITDYEIKTGIAGKEKVDFIKSCKVHYNPALRESFCFAWLECLPHMPCVAIDKQSWTSNFDEKFFSVVSEKDAAKEIERLYNKEYDDSALEYVKNMDNKSDSSWKDFLDSYTATENKSNAANINNYDTVKYSDFIVSLNRSSVARIDFVSVLSNKSKFFVTYTDDNTWFSKDENFVPQEQNTGETLEGLF